MCYGSWGCKESDMAERLNWTEKPNKISTIFIMRNYINIGLPWWLYNIIYLYYIIFIIYLIYHRILYYNIIYNAYCNILGFSGGSTGKESVCNVGDQVSISGLGRSLGEENGHPLQYSGLENSIDSTVPGVAKSQAQLSDFHFTSLWLKESNKNWMNRERFHFHG